MTDNTNPQDLIALLRTFIGDTQIVRAAREAADLIEQQAARIAEQDAQLANAGENITDLEAKIAAPRGTDAQILHERKLTCEAINGSIAFGYQDTNPPPSADHWLAAFWKIGRKQAELEAAPVADIAMAKDAERYRWLKSMREDFDLIGRHSYYATDLWNVLGRKPIWDEAIDAAIAASAEKGDKA